MKRWATLVIIGLLLAGVSLFIAPLARPVHGQSAPTETPGGAPGCPPVNGAPVGCVDASLSPATLTADFYVNGVLAAPRASAARLFVPPGADQHLEVRNVRDGSSFDGSAYIYENTSIYVTLAAGEVQSAVFQPRTVYFKGFVRVTCDMLDLTDPADFTCRPFIDGSAQPDLLPGQNASYALTGTHTIHVELKGGQADRWDPASVDGTFNFTPGLFEVVNATFSKKGLLTIALSQPGVAGDLYVDDLGVANQAPTAQVWVAPAKVHKVQGKKFDDPQAGGAYHWRDVTAQASVAAGGEATLTLTPVKDTQMGFLNLTCQVNGKQPGDDVACDITADDADVASLAAGGRGRYGLWPGSYQLVVTLTGGSAAAFSGPYSAWVTILPGQTAYVTASFTTLASQPAIYPPEKLSLSGISPYLRDIYLNGQALGNNPHAFSKIGDSDSWTPRFFQPIAAGNYDLGSFGNLQDVITYFSPSDSFSHVGQSAFPGFMAQAIVDPLWADRPVCQPDETPLACEYRLHRPSVALILVRTLEAPVGPGSSYDVALRRIVEYSIQQGVIPVLSTQPHLSSPWPSEVGMNVTIRQVAADYNVPLWDLWATTEPLPFHGVDADNHLNWAPDNRVTYFVWPYFKYGETRRNLEALMVLHEILRQVIQP